MQAVWEDTRRRLSALPLLREFHEHVLPKLADGPHRLSDCWEDFAALVRGRLMDSFIEEELRAMAAEPEYHPKDATDTHMVVLKTDAFMLRAVLIRDRSDANTLNGLAEHLLFAVLGPGPLGLQVFTQSAPDPHDRLDRTRLLLRQEPEILPVGTIRHLRALQDVPAFDPVGGVPTLLLMLASRPVSAIRWNYDRQTLAPKQMVSSDGTVSRLEHTIRLLSQMGQRSSLGPLTRMLDHSQHFVRWAALRAIGRIDSQLAVEKLREATRDSHPYIRNAAARSLARSGIDVSVHVATPPDAKV